MRLVKSCFQYFRNNPVLFAWTPLVSSSDFTGIQTDVGTVVTSMITIFIIIAGFAVLVRVFTR